MNLCSYYNSFLWGDCFKTKNSKKKNSLTKLNKTVYIKTNELEYLNSLGLVSQGKGFLLCGQIRQLLSFFVIFVFLSRYFTLLVI